MLKKTENIILIGLVLLVYIMQFVHWNGAYLDTDNYTYVLRVVDWLQHPAWFEQKFSYSNYPFGEVKHWTRLMDIIITVCSAPFLLFEPVKQAVFYGGLLLTPLFLLLTVWVLKKLGDDIMNLRGKIVLFLLLYIQDCFIKTFALNRPDHHAVHIFLAVLLLWLLHQYIKSHDKKLLSYAGLTCSLFIWTAVEGIIPYGITLFFLYLGYSFFKYPYGAMQKFAVSSALCLTFFWLINPPLQGWTFPDNGRLSVLYVICMWYIVLILYLIKRIDNRYLQFGSAGISALILFIGLWSGGYLTSPLDETIRDAFINRISEMEKGANIYNLAYPILGLYLWIIMLYKNSDKQVLSLLGIFAVAYLMLSLWAKRFCNFEAIYGTLIISYWVSRLSIRKITFFFLVLLLASLEFIAFAVNACFHHDLTKKIQSNMVFNIKIFEKYPFKKGSVVTDTFIAPYVMWYADRPTIASPYHTNIQGIRDNHDILFSDDEQKVLRLISAHKVKTIVMPIRIEDDYYAEPEHNCNKLYGKIMGCHNYPVWLIEKEKNEHENYVIFEIDSELVDELRHHF